MLISFLVWVAKNLFDIKQAIAKIETKLDAGDEKHANFEERIKRLEELTAKHSTQLGVLEVKK